MISKVLDYIGRPIIACFMQTLDRCTCMCVYQKVNFNNTETTLECRAFAFKLSFTDAAIYLIDSTHSYKVNTINTQKSFIVRIRSLLIKKKFYSKSWINHYEFGVLHYTFEVKCVYSTYCLNKFININMFV